MFNAIATHSATHSARAVSEEPPSGEAKYHAPPRARRPSEGFVYGQAKEMQSDVEASCRNRLKMGEDEASYYKDGMDKPAGVVMGITGFGSMAEYAGFEGRTPPPA